MNNENIVEFEVVSTINTDIKIAGYVDLSEIDEYDEYVYFYDDKGFEHRSRLPTNPYAIGSVDFELYEQLKQEWIFDELFVQFICDYADEEKEVTRNGYFLKINAGGR